VLTAADEMTELVGHPRLVCGVSFDSCQWHVEVKQICDGAVECMRHLVARVYVVQRSPVNLCDRLTQQRSAVDILASNYHRHILTMIC